ncbi:hypothetical protein P4O66_015597 [Electrophorus voltai]|uniref:Protein SAAL1 n=1 Tax=Electrophorus voltai TaxID=2609070 RepID=A0AAD9DS16_9TELE|nr:hypothetical protein P4O66_015597 [Electrophorus voltai]
MDRNENFAEEADDNRSSRSSSPPDSPNSPEMDRNPSPPPEGDDETAEEADAIGETVYSKHWLFSTLTRLIQMVTEHESHQGDSLEELSEEQENELCKVWDMAMDKDVAGFLQEFKAPDILLGVITKSHSPRLTEICVGILGNMACFHETCVSLSQNADLGLLLTCVSQPDVAPLWLERIQQQTATCSNLCFIMRSSTNVELLMKVGELVDKLLDEDEELMKSWLSRLPSESHQDKNTHQDITVSLLEAAVQIRKEGPEALEAYMHALQLLTTVDEGLQHLGLSLVGSLLRIQYFYAENQRNCWDRVSEQRQTGENRRDEAERDIQTQAVVEIAGELLSAVLTCMPRDAVSDLMKDDHLTDKIWVATLKNLLPEYITAVQCFLSTLEKVEPNLAGILKQECSIPSEPVTTKLD